MNYFSLLLKNSKQCNSNGRPYFSLPLRTIFSDTIKASWDSSKPAKDNLDTMGLAYDPNKVVKHLTAKKKMVESLKENAGTAIHHPESGLATTCKFYSVCLCVENHRFALFLDIR